MKSSIVFSDVYVSVLEKLQKIVASLTTATKKSLLIFKNSDKYMISIMDMNTLVSVSATKEHCLFDVPELPIKNFGEFMDFIEAVDYPSELSSIYMDTEVATNGKQYDVFGFKGDRNTYRTTVGEITNFDPKYDRKIPNDRENDPLELVSKFVFDVNDVKRINKDIKLMGNPDTFAIVINNDILSIYMKSLQGSQSTITLDPMCCAVFNNYTTKSKKENYKLFPTKIFTFMASFPCDFEIELRRLVRGDGDFVAIKAYGAINVEGMSQINVLVGTQESTSQVSTHQFEIIE